MKTARRRSLLILLLLGVFVLGQTGYFDWGEIHGHIEPVSGRWWALPLVIVLQAVLYALALPGSAFLIIVPLFYSPALSTVIVVIGGGIGALLGYLLAHHLGIDWTGKIEKHRMFRLLQRNSDFLTLCAMRVLPGFPHAVINFGSGFLQLPLRSFLLATAAGFTAKGFLYAVLVNEAVQADTVDDFIRLESIWPLFVLVALLGVGRLVRRRWLKEG